MHSFWQRLNALFFYALSVLGFLSFMGAGTTYWHVSNPKIELTLERILLRKIYGAGHDQAILSLGIDADLRSVFNWNVKQLFVYVTAEYETEANVRACACIVPLIGPCRPCVRRYAIAFRPSLCVETGSQSSGGLGSNHLRSGARLDSLELRRKQVLVDRPGM